MVADARQNHPSLNSLCLRRRLALVVLLHGCLEQLVGADFLERPPSGTFAAEPAIQGALDASVFFASDIVNPQDSLPLSLAGKHRADPDFQGEHGHVLINTVDLSEQEETKATLPRALSSSADAPFILRLKNVHLASAQGSDKYHSYVRHVVLKIAESLDLEKEEVEPVALLVYKDTNAAIGSRHNGYGYVVVLFLLEIDCHHASASDLLAKKARGLCPVDAAANKKAWINTLSLADSALTRAFRDKLDPDFPPQLTPALCARWEITGPGCRTSSYARNPYMQDQQGLPLWFVMGVGTTSMLLCAVYPIYRMVQNRDSRTRQGEQSQTPIETLKTDLKELKREKLSVSALEEDATCSICLVSLTDDLKEHLLLAPCRHRMHACCAEGWFAKHLQCPMCRRTFGAKECVIEELVENPGDSKNRKPNSENGAELAGRTCEGEGDPSPRVDDNTAGQVDRGLADTGADCQTEEATEESARRDLGLVADTNDQPMPPLMPAPTTPSSPPTYTISDPRSSLMSMSFRAGPRNLQLSRGTPEGNANTLRTERSETNEIPL